MHQRPVYRVFETMVTKVQDVTPRMRRITLHGESLRDFASDRPGQWVKLFFDETETGRAFTIRHWRPEALEMDIDIVRHETGIAGEWIAAAQPGLPVRLAGPRSHFEHAPGRMLFLFGDETALPAISAIAENLPDDARAVAVIEVSDTTAIQKIATDARVDWSWLTGDHSSPGHHLSVYVRHLTLNPETAQIWVGCECAAARQMRCELTRLGFDKESLHVSGYWKKGAAEHVDCDSDY